MSKTRVRSGFEGRVLERLSERTTDWEYEGESLQYYLGPKWYTPDIVFPDGTYVEIKGYFKAKDRQLLLAVREYHPGIVIRLLFQRNNKLNSRAKMRYSDWCERHGFEYAIGEEIPDAWAGLAKG